MFLLVATPGGRSVGLTAVPARLCHIEGINERIPVVAGR